MQYDLAHKVDYNRFGTLGGNGDQIFASSRLMRGINVIYVYVN
jgi:hypothetical protein